MRALENESAVTSLTHGVMRLKWQDGTCKWRENTNNKLIGNLCSHVQYENHHVQLFMNCQHKKASADSGFLGVENKTQEDYQLM